MVLGGQIKLFRGFDRDSFGVLRVRGFLMVRAAVRPIFLRTAVSPSATLDFDAADVVQAG